MTSVTPEIPRFAHVALPIPKRTLFTYAIPPRWIEACRPGMRVLVPVGGHTRAGVVWRVDDTPPPAGTEIRPLTALPDPEPLLDAGLLALLEWMVRYYMQPHGEVAALALPVATRPVQRQRVRLATGLAMEKARQEAFALPDALRPLAEAILSRRPGLSMETLVRQFGREQLENRLKRLERLGLVERVESWVSQTPTGRVMAPPEEQTLTPPPELTPEQEQCVVALCRAMEEKSPPPPILLHGITGSGKTEVYLRAVAHCLSLGRQALLLAPEIALTPQLEQRYRQRFREGLAIFHSGLGEAERMAHWRDLRSGRARVALGARSALFAPFSDLGLVVVDEEHDASYKQEEGVPYQARDMAVVRGRLAGATVVLGSATPSLESHVNAQEGRYRLLRLERRATGAALPRVECVDLRPPPGAPVKPGPWERLLGKELCRAITETLARQRQVLLFLNRRGFAPVLLCSRCGHTPACPNCSVSFTWHKARGRLICHYCDFSQGVMNVCPMCGQLSLHPFGPGTQQLEQAVTELFPAARSARLDRDSVGVGGRDLTATLEAFAGGELDILLGTQMIAKGHHFPRLALVGVVLAELSLLQPDFRAAERTFQQLTQVAGRAGREREEGEPPARVLMQSFDPRHYAIQAALTHDTLGFLEQEAQLRQEAGFPPYTRLALLRFSCLEQAEGEAFAARLRQHLPVEPEAEILGPTPAPIFKLRGRFRWQVLVKAPGRSQGVLHRAAGRLLQTAERLAPARIRVDLDVDPYTF